MNRISILKNRIIPSVAAAALVFASAGMVHAQGDASGQGGMAGQSGSQSGSQKNQGDQGYEKRHGQGHGKDHGKGHGKGHESDKHHMKGSQKKDVGASDTSTGGPLPGGTSDGSQTTGSGNRY